MNKQPASLINQQDSLPVGHSSDINPVIEQYMPRPGQSYLSPGYIIDAYPGLGPWGMPYWMVGLATQTCNNLYITAPTPWQASIITHSSPTLYGSGQYGIGAAPTGGIYTGVEDSCS